MGSFKAGGIVVGSVAALGVTALVVQEAAPVAGPYYSADDIIRFFVQAGLLAAIVGPLVVNIITARRTAAKVEATAVKTDILVARVEEVKIATDGGLTAVKAEVLAMKAELATASALNAQLHIVIADLKAEREKAALAAVALATPTAPKKK